MTGMSQSTLAQIESGKRAVSAELLERILRAADYRPSVPLARYASSISTSKSLLSARAGAAGRREHARLLPADALAEPDGALRRLVGCGIELSVQPAHLIDDWAAVGRVWHEVEGALADLPVDHAQALGTPLVEDELAKRRAAKRQQAI